LSWGEIAIVFFVSHLVGDFLFQTDWQARNKEGGLGRNRVARRALLSHTCFYGLAFIPALVWVATGAGMAVAVLIALVITLPHMVVDDGRLLIGYMKRFKGCSEPVPPVLKGAVDQSTHIIFLFATALLTAGLA